MKQDERFGYCCTWLTQNYLAEQIENGEREAGKFAGDQGGGAQLARSLMGEEFLFGENGFATLFEKSRKDLYLLLDDGWDVDYAARGDSFGSLVVDGERFPSVRGLEPWERLYRLSERAKGLGWKGLGIWIAAQCAGGLYAKPFSEEVKDYWRERLVWSKKAGVCYWKVDWGVYGGDHAFRAFLSEAAKEIYPELVVEHAVCCQPFNGNFLPENDRAYGRYAGDLRMAEKAEKTLSYSQVFRSYDVLAPLSVATTLDRLAFFLGGEPKGYVNAEDELYIAATLGCQMGIMRSALGSSVRGSTRFNGRIGEQGSECNRIDEVDAAVAWQREFPPFTGGRVELSDEILFDDYTFLQGETWYEEAWGKRIRQGAPAAIARNTALPRVSAGAGGEKPFVCAAKHPNGNYAVCILPRTVDGKYGFVGGEAVCEIPNGTKRAAVFGKAERVVFLFPDGRTGRVAAKSLLGGKTRYLPIEKGAVTLTEEAIAELWKSDDKSLPAITVYVEEE